MLERTIPTLVVAVFLVIGIIIIANKSPTNGRKLAPVMTWIAPAITATMLFLVVAPLGQHAHVSGPVGAAIVAPVLVHVAHRPALAAFANPFIFLSVCVVMYLVTGQDKLADNYHTQYEPLGVMLYIAFGTVASFITGLFGLIGSIKQQ